MAHPDWTLKHKVKNSEIRNIRGNYYLYATTSKWDPAKGRNKKVTLGMIGVLKEKEGLIPTGQSRKGRPPKNPASKNISIKEFGATHFLQTLSSDILSNLKDHYPNDWESLFTLAANRLIYQVPLKDCDFLYEESFLSETMKEANINKNSLTEILKNVGEDREKIVKFMQKLTEGAKHIVFDTTQSLLNSKSKDSEERGYDSLRDYDLQVNLVYMFSVDKQMPTYYRIFPGNISETKALNECLDESKISDCVAIVDKGFYSKKNLELLDDANLKYILPLKRDSLLVNYDRLESNSYEKAFDGHYLYNEEPIFYTCLNEQDGKKVTIFKDKNLELKEDKMYLRRMNMGQEGYTLEEYKREQLKFGTISMITNCLDKSPQEIYESYKARMEIETLFDTYKNLLNEDRSYISSDESMEGWIFINHLATMMYYRIFNLLKKNDLLKTTSPIELLMTLSRINITKTKERWELGVVNGKTEKLMTELNIKLPTLF